MRWKEKMEGGEGVQRCLERRPRDGEELLLRGEWNRVEKQINELRTIPSKEKRRLLGVSNSGVILQSLLVQID